MNNELYYERLAHGEVPMGTEISDQDRVDQLLRGDAEFLEKHSPAAFIAAVKAKRRGRILKRLNLAAGAVAACLVVAFIVPAFGRRGDQTRMKGAELNIFLYHKTENGSEILPSEAVLSRGDEVQVAYFVRGKAFAAIFSVDGRGTVTRHMPLHGENALEVNTENFAVLPYSYTLDDAPSFEDVYLIVSPKVFKADSIIPFLRAGFDNGTSNILLPAPYRFHYVRIRKSEASK